jgi:hypothetical protein
MAVRRARSSGGQQGTTFHRSGWASRPWQLIGDDPKTIDDNPGHQPEPAMDAGWFQYGVQPREDRCRPIRPRPPLPRPARDGSNAVLCRGITRAGYHRDHGVGRGTRHQNHQALRRPGGGHQSNHPPTQPGRKENSRCRTDYKIDRVNWC